MALSDRLATFCTNFDQDLEAGTALATNQYDLGASGRDPGNGQVLYVNFVVDELFSTGSSPTAEFRVVSDDTASIHATTMTIHASTGPIAAALLVAGYRFSIPLPVGGPAYERYLGVQCLIATATTTTGTVTAWLGLEPVGKITLFADAQN